MRVFLGYLNQSTDDLEIVSSDSELILTHLKKIKGTEWEYAYVDIWENNLKNLERIPLDDFEKKYKKNKV